MAAPIALRDDFDGDRLRSLARASKDAAQTRRLLALALIYDGESRQSAARLGGVGLQVVRDWVLRFNARGPAGLISGRGRGSGFKLTAAQRQALAERVEAGPIPAVDGVVRWRRKDLGQWLYEEFRVSLDESTVGRYLKAMGYAKLSVRPRHYAQDTQALEEFKKTSPTRSTVSGRDSRRIPR